MKILRFEDPSGVVRSGQPTDDSLNFARLSSGEILAVARILPPVDAVNILCIGLNYRRHAAESNMAVPERPILFLKPTSTVIAHGESILHPDTKELDYECELAIIIGKAAKNVSEADALDYVAGYTCANDVSARDWQLRLDKQWARGKSFDTFCPLGPVLVTPDEIPDPDALQIQTRVNGVTLQNSNTADLIFSTRQIIAYLSKDMTLMPGTVILTGTPEGVAMGRSPSPWLKPGDVVEIEIEGIGILRNPVALSPAPNNGDKR